MTTQPPSPNPELQKLIEEGEVLNKELQAIKIRITDLKHAMYVEAIASAVADDQVHLNQYPKVVWVSTPYDVVLYKNDYRIVRAKEKSLVIRRAGGEEIKISLKTGKTRYGQIDVAACSRSWLDRNTSAYPQTNDCDL